MRTKKPRCCPDPTCEILFCMDHADDDPGDSFDCYGKIPEVTFIWNGNEHTNNISHCTYTPLKGTIRYLENKDDQDLMIQNMFRLLALLGVTAFNINWYFSGALNIPEIDAIELDRRVIHLTSEDTK